MFIKTLVEGKIPVKALIDTASKSNTISKSLFDKLEEDYGLEYLPGDDLIGEEIKCLDLQFHYTIIIKESGLYRSNRLSNS